MNQSRDRYIVLFLFGWLVRPGCTFDLSHRRFSPTFTSGRGATTTLAFGLSQPTRTRGRSARQPGLQSLFVTSDSSGDEGVYSDEEWHPRDPAFTTPQLLAGLWHQIAQSGTMSRGVRTLLL